jgi:hypothetical protein
MTLDGAAYEIVGVLGRDPGFFLSPIDYYLPLRPAPVLGRHDRRSRLSMRSLRTPGGRTRGRLWASTSSSVALMKEAETIGLYQKDPEGCAERTQAYITHTKRIIGTSSAPEQTQPSVSGRNRFAVSINPGSRYSTMRNRELKLTLNLEIAP